MDAVLVGPAEGDAMQGARAAAVRALQGTGNAAARRPEPQTLTIYSGWVLNDQSELDMVLTSFPWHDAFVKEAHVLSPSYVAKSGAHVVAPNSLWTFRLLVCSSERTKPAIEFSFEETDQIILSSLVELQPHGIVNSDGVEIFMSTSDLRPIRAKRVWYRYLEAGTVWGWQSHYGTENLFDEGGFRLDEQ
jgi:hypothetical protein